MRITNEGAKTNGIVVERATGQSLARAARQVHQQNLQEAVEKAKERSGGLTDPKKVKGGAKTKVDVDPQLATRSESISASTKRIGDWFEVQVGTSVVEQEASYALVPAVSVASRGISLALNEDAYGRTHAFEHAGTGARVHAYVSGLVEDTGDVRVSVRSVNNRATPEMVEDFLAEISKKTLGSYVKKAAENMGGYEAAKTVVGTRDPKWKDYAGIADKRRVDSLAEEMELNGNLLTEVSNGMMSQPESFGWKQADKSRTYTGHRYAEYSHPDHPGHSLSMYTMGSHNTFGKDGNRSVPAQTRITHTSDNGKTVHFDKTGPRVGSKDLVKHLSEFHKSHPSAMHNTQKSAADHEAAAKWHEDRADAIGHPMKHGIPMHAAHDHPYWGHKSAASMHRWTAETMKSGRPAADQEKATANTVAEKKVPHAPGMEDLKR